MRFVWLVQCRFHCCLVVNRYHSPVSHRHHHPLLIYYILIVLPLADLPGLKVFVYVAPCMKLCYFLTFQLRNYISPSYSNFPLSSFLS